MGRSLVLLAVLLAAAVPAQAQRVAPVEKVLTLLTDLKTEVENEGKTEATNYDAYACFCQSTTTEKSTSITAGRDAIDGLSAAIAEDTADKAMKSTELGERKTKQEELNTELAETRSRYAKEKSEYESTEVDLRKAVQSLDKAITSMSASKPGALLLEVRKSVQESLVLADGLNLIAESKRKAVTAFFQTKEGVDPSDPEYKYHSQGIIDTLSDLLKDFTAEKMTLDTEWAATTKTFNDTVVDLNGQIDANKIAMDQLEADIERLTGKIATDRGTLVTTEGVLKDDQLYLKDLTVQCEARANDWDQRASMRRDELAALVGALEVLTEKVKEADAVNQRALLQVPEAPARKVSIAPHSESVAFVQEVATINQAKALLRGTRSGLSTQARQARVVDVLKKEGHRLSSPILSTLAMKVAADPFTKIKGLIQKLIERLLAESEAEATKKGFCDTELAKANTDRDFRMKDAQDLNLDLEALEIKKSDLEAEIALLKDEISTLTTNLDTAKTLREEERDDNIATIGTAKGGFKAVTEAIAILKVFYKTAERRAGALLQYSPVDENTSGPGFAGKYAGKQEASKGILGMLEVIRTDFDRTLRTTEAAEKKAHEEFTEFDRTSRSDIAGKTTKQLLDEEDLETTDNTITEKMADLQTAVDLLDSALQRIEELKGTCIDTGMSFEERVSKRKAEMEALRTALCILDTENVESKCED